MKMVWEKVKKFLIAVLIAGAIILWGLFLAGGGN